MHPRALAGAFKNCRRRRSREGNEAEVFFAAKIPLLKSATILEHNPRILVCQKIAASRKIAQAS